MRPFVCLILAAAVAGCASGPALSWGSSGHRMITVAALQSLPTDLPEFVRLAENVGDAGEWSREPDRWRLAGAVHDTLRDAFHYSYADDDGKLGGGPAFATLPATLSAYQAAVRKAGGDPEATGYLPYAIIDGWQQVTKDFVYWRADRAGLRLTRDPARLTWLQGDKRRREVQLIHDIGLFAHYVGDATQPMHLTVHHDGWGDLPNPDGYTLARVHIPYEGAYVARSVTLSAVRAAMQPLRASPGPIEATVGDYLTTASQEVRPWYGLEKAGAFKPGDRRGAIYTSGRLGVAASMLRDLIVAAWVASADGKVNYPLASLRDIEAGRVDALDALRGPD